MSMVPGLSSAVQTFSNSMANATQQTAQASGSASSLLGGAVGASVDVSPTYETPFSGVLREAVAKTQELDTQAANTVSDMLAGKGVDIHTAMIATEKSDLAFEMMLALRNKAVGAYQQLMGMQF
ncbi:MAG: flagellar hook-basal body complex protein FliE [Acidobacteriaceae bacterium]